MKPPSRLVRCATLVLAVSFLGAQPWVSCGVACQFQLWPGQSLHHESGHQTLQCHTGSWTQTAVAPFASLGLGLPSPSMRQHPEPVTRVDEIAHRPAPLSSWISAYEPPPPRV